MIPYNHNSIITVGDDKYVINESGTTDGREKTSIEKMNPKKNYSGAIQTGIDAKIKNGIIVVPSQAVDKNADPEKTGKNVVTLQDGYMSLYSHVSTKKALKPGAHKMTKEEVNAFVEELKKHCPTSAHMQEGPENI
ncbi:MAG: hypothetical protein ACI4T8_01375 [Christensenellales bacterium]